MTLSKDDAADKAFKAVKIDKHKAKNLKDKVIKEKKLKSMVTVINTFIMLS